jgi:hypothetical protein
VTGAQLMLHNFFMHIEEYNLKDSTQKSRKTATLTPKIFSDHQPQKFEAENILQLSISTKTPPLMSNTYLRTPLDCARTSINLTDFIPIVDPHLTKNLFKSRHRLLFLH